MTTAERTGREDIKTATGLYLYCVVDAGEIPEGGWDISGLEGQPLGSIAHRQVSAVVSDAVGQRQNATRENLTTHTLVLEKILEHQQILPIRFGIVANRQEDVINKVLKPNYWKFSELLSQLKGKKELGVKVLWNRGSILNQILAEDEQIRQLRDSLDGKPEEAIYYEKIKLGRFVEAALTSKRSLIKDEILKALNTFSIDCRENQLLTENMVLNAAFLVPEGNEGEFESALNDLNSKFAEALIFKFTAVAPPYNFVNITIKL